jgi:DNA-binding response OmpR family regulator
MDSSQSHILLVDDDVELAELLIEFLRREGLAARAVHSGEEGVRAALGEDDKSSGEISAVVLDVMLPGIGGFEVLRRIRASGGPAARLPVLMLTAKGDEVDRVLGLELGADDYLPKPFSSRELVARLRAILRRAETPPLVAAPEADTVFRVGDVELDTAARTVKRGGETLELTSVEFHLLQILLANAGEVVTRDHIAREVLGRVLLSFDRSVDTHVSNLRRKLGTYRGGERIKTVRSVGYVYARPPRED